MDIDPSSSIISGKTKSIHDDAADVTQNTGVYADAEEYSPLYGGRTAPNKANVLRPSTDVHDDERFADITMSSVAFQCAETNEDELSFNVENKPLSHSCSAASEANMRKIIHNSSKHSKPPVSLFSPLSIQLREMSSDFVKEGSREPQGEQSNSMPKPVIEPGPSLLQTIKEDTTGLKARGSTAAEEETIMDAQQEPAPKVTSPPINRLGRVTFATKVRNTLLSCRAAFSRVIEKTANGLNLVACFVYSMALYVVLTINAGFRFVFNLPIQLARRLQQYQNQRRAALESRQSSDENNENSETLSNDEEREKEKSEIPSEDNNHLTGIEETSVQSREFSVASGEASEHISADAEVSTQEIEQVVEKDHIQTLDGQLTLPEGGLPTIEEIERAAGFNTENSNEFDCCENEGPSNGQQLPTKPQHFNPEGDGLVGNVDNTKITFEDKNSEIIMRPLREANIPFFDSTHESDGSDAGRDVKSYGSSSSALRNRDSSEGKSGKHEVRRKLRAFGDVKGVTGSIKRALIRTKTEPETRFASPRSARKTMTIIADLLVKEYSCEVAVRKTGSLKLRGEKAMSTGHPLRIRVSFQELDSFSCNVMISRSKEDDMGVSTYEYVNFIADLQRSFSDMVTPERT